MVSEVGSPVGIFSGRDLRGASASIGYSATSSRLLLFKLDAADGWLPNYYPLDARVHDPLLGGDESERRLYGSVSTGTHSVLTYSEYRSAVTFDST